MASGKLFKKVARKKAELRKARTKILNQIAPIKAGPKANSSDNAKRVAFNAITLMQVFAEQFSVSLKQLGDQHLVAGTKRRWLQINEDIWRLKKVPDVLLSVFLITLGLVFEGLVTAVVMVADGRVDVIVGVAYGMIFATVNSGCGIVAGSALRFINYRKNSRNPSQEDEQTRKVALIMFLSTLAVLALLIFTAARVRVIGSHEHIFNFFNVGLFETFNDGLAILLIVIGLLSSIIAIWKGYTGFSDPNPVYEHISYDTENEIQDTAEELQQETLDKVETVFAEAEELILEQHYDQDDVHKINALIETHNSAVHTAKDDLLSQEIAEFKERRFVTQQKTDFKSELNVSFFDELLLEQLETTVVEPDADSEEALKRLREEHSRVVAHAMTAFVEFLSGLNVLEFPRPEITPGE